MASGSSRKSFFFGFVGEAIVPWAGLACSLNPKGCCDGLVTLAVGALAVDKQNANVWEMEREGGEEREKGGGKR